MMIIKTILLMMATDHIKGSIVGLTYRDHFDFEDRYRDANECNPFYWHPLHLPMECVEMYEKLIRSNLATLGPVRVFKERFFDEDQYGNVHSIMPSALRAGVGMYVNRRPLSPIEKMIEMIRSDAMTIPTAPQIHIAPQYGLVAAYHQPISSRSEKAIKEIATAYRNSMLQNYG